MPYAETVVTFLDVTKAPSYATLGKNNQENIKISHLQLLWNCEI